MARLTKLNPTRKPVASQSRVLLVNVHWDGVARVFWANSDDVPGLVSEAPTFDALVKRVTAVAPELLADNRPDLKGDCVITFVTTRSEHVRVA